MEASLRDLVTEVEKATAARIANREGTPLGVDEENHTGVENSLPADDENGGRGGKVPRRARFDGEWTPAKELALAAAIAKFPLGYQGTGVGRASRWELIAAESGLGITIDEAYRRGRTLEAIIRGPLSAEETVIVTEYLKQTTGSRKNWANLVATKLPGRDPRDITNFARALTESKAGGKRRGRSPKGPKKDAKSPNTAMAKTRKGRPPAKTQPSASPRLMASSSAHCCFARGPSSSGVTIEGLKKLVDDQEEAAAARLLGVIGI